MKTTNEMLDQAAGILMDLIDCGWYSQAEAEAALDKFAAKAARPRVLRAYVRSLSRQAMDFCEEHDDIMQRCRGILAA